MTEFISEHRTAIWIAIEAGMVIGIGICMWSIWRDLTGDAGRLRRAWKDEADRIADIWTENSVATEGRHSNGAEQ